MEYSATDVRRPDALAAWQQALAEVPQTPALSGALLRPRDDLFRRFAAWYGRLRSRPRAERRRWQRQLGLSLAGIALLLAVNGAPAGAVGPAATITVSGPCDLIEAIGNANDTTTGQPNTDCAAGNPAGADTIDLQVNVTLTASNSSYFGPTGLPVVTSAITIEGNGNAISRQAGSPNFRILAVAIGGNLTLNSATVSGGVTGGGGGIYNRRGTLTVQNSTLSGNSANNNGGGILNSGTLTVSNSILSGNSATFYGGGINNVFSGRVTVQNSTLSGNSAARSGGGISNTNYGTVTVSNSTLSGNSANNNGGGIYNAFGTLTVSNSTLSGNSANGGGGGILNRFSGRLTVQNSTLSGNSANGTAGIANIDNGSTLTVQNSTISGNSAPNGGGIRNAGGIFSDVLATATVQNSIVAAQTWGYDCGGSGTFNSGGYNIESGTSCPFTQASDLRNVSSASLALGALANNGGPTQTMALGAGSVAIDGIPVGALEANGCGVTVIADQRSAPRAGGPGNGGSACDVGAYEFASTPLAVTLASFDAQAMIDHILLSWETVSEIDNAGFNLYRSGSPAAPDALLAFVPSQAPGSTQGASYSFDDTQVAPGQTWYYWLEDVDLNGATTLHGPVSATLEAPTAVRITALGAQAARPTGGLSAWGALVAGLIGVAGALGARRRSRAG